MRAVCLSCGAAKWGALTACRACGARPGTLEEQARAMLASEDELDDAGLEALAERVRSGGDVVFDAEAVESLVADLERVPVAPLGWTLLVVGGPFVALVLLGVLAIAVCAG
ncbi:MAG: hypothetical protein H6737_03570 [Alphaproteobacteria bacterium]|nr:hypothetical protein [Alphaproteobacteria bacterium]